MMRVTERTAIRAGLPLAYSQGFNPRPVLSLVCPRPVGVASRDDLLVVSLAEPMQAEDLLRRLNRHVPRGMEFVRAGTLAGKGTPRPVRADYELRLPPRAAPDVQARLDDLDRRESWPVERLRSAGRRKRRAPAAPRTLDLKPMVAQVGCSGGTLRWVLVPQGDQWARPGELLGLLGLDPRVDLAGVVRTAVRYQPAPQPQDGSDPPRGPTPGGP